MYEQYIPCSFFIFLSSFLIGFQMRDLCRYQLWTPVTRVWNVTPGTPVVAVKCLTDVPIKFKTPFMSLWTAYEACDGQSRNPG